MKFINRWLECLTLIVVVCAVSGCGKSGDAAPVSDTPPKPAQAAQQIQQVFQTANPEIKSQADAISKALQQATYEQAIQTIQTIKARPNLNVEQGMAIYNTERSLESTLLAGVAAGDKNAIRAYELLKKSHRN